jgi:pyruvate formate lyase activating enzyme
MNPQIYKEYTGLDNSRLLENLEILCEKGLQDKCKIRIPNIPGFTLQADIDKAVDSMENMGFRNLEVFDYIIRGEKERDE